MIEVSAGGEVGGFHLTLVEAYTYNVSGRVLGSDGSPAQSVRIITVNQSRAGQISLGGGTTTDLQGAFTVAGLLPGKHRLIARRGRGQEPQIASASVEVIDQDIQGSDAGSGVWCVHHRQNCVGERGAIPGLGAVFRWTPGRLKAVAEVSGFVEGEAGLRRTSVSGSQTFPEDSIALRSTFLLEITTSSPSAPRDRKLSTG